MKKYEIGEWIQTKFLFGIKGIVVNIFQLTPKHRPDDSTNNNGKEGVENTYKYKNYNSKIPSYTFWSKNN